MNRLRKLTMDYPLVAAIIAWALIILIFHIDVWFLGVDFSATLFPEGVLVGETLDRILITIVCILFLILFLKSNLKDIGYTTENLGSGLRLGFLVVLIPLVSAAFSYLMAITSGSGHFLSTPGEALHLLDVVLECIAVGLYEETAYRAVLINILRNKKGLEGRKMMFYCIILSSVLFGFMHSVNILGGYYTPIAGMGEVIQTMGAGMIFAAIYWRTGSLISSVLCHALWDFLLIAREYIYIPNHPAEGVAAGGIANIIVASLFLIIDVVVALILLRPKTDRGCQIKVVTLREQAKDHAGGIH